MTFQIEDFELGDIVRDGDGEIGTVMFITDKWLVVDCGDFGVEHIKPSFIKEIIEVADGERKIGVHKTDQTTSMAAR